MRNAGLLGASALVLLVATGLWAGSVAATADVENVTVYSTTEEFSDAEALEAEIAAGRMDSNDRVYLGDTLVVAIQSDRLAADVANESGPATDRFFAVLDGKADLRIDRPANAHRNFVVARLGPDNVTALRSDATTYLLVDVAAVDFYYDTRNEIETDPELDVEYDVYFSYEVDLDDRTPISPTPSGPAFKLSRTEGRFPTDQRFDGIPPEEVDLRTRVYERPARDVKVRAVFGDGRHRTGTVTARTWPTTATPTVDFGGIDPGTKYTVELVYDGSTIDRFEGSIREPTATLTNANATRSGTETVVDVTASLSHGGGIVVVDDEGYRIGQTAVEGDGVARNVSIDLPASPTDRLSVQAVRDLDGDRDPYENEGAELTVNVTVDEGGNASASNETSETTDTPTPSAEERASFLLIGILGVVVALVAGVLLFVKLAL